MKIIARQKSEQNEAIVDPWTAVHTTSGLAMGLLDISFRTSVSLAVAYEIVEHFAQQREVGRSFFNVSGPETLLNSVVDVIVFAIGHDLGRRWNATGEQSDDRDRDQAG